MLAGIFYHGWGRITRITRMGRVRGERTLGAATQMPAFFTADYTDILDYTDGDQAFCAYDRGYAFPPG